MRTLQLVSLVILQFTPLHLLFKTKRRGLNRTLAETLTVSQTKNCRFYMLNSVYCGEQKCQGSDAW